MKNNQLSLIPFASETNQQAVWQLIEGMGYKVDVFSNENWLSTDERELGALSVLLLDKYDLPLETIQKISSRESRPPLFAIIGNARFDSNAQILELCDDFTTWPCREHELSCRLERLAGYKDRPVFQFDEGKLLDEFIELNLIGKSEQFISTLNHIKKISRCDAPVLIEGETGTGKEVTARAIHYLGKRHAYPFVPVNCGAVPDNLFENELFGHEKGAFTDARESQPGLISEAEGGTLFLDEIDAMSPKAQVALLRFLQDQQYRPLGAKKSRQANVRVITATNTDLAGLVKAGEFREDLYFRINIMSVEIPPLRERGGDVKILAEHFVQLYREQYNEPNKYLSAKTLHWLQQYCWPGNVRELENTLHRLFLLADNEAIQLEHSVPGIKHERRRNYLDRRIGTLTNKSFSEAKTLVVDEFEKKYLQWLMAQTGGNVSRAAKIAGKERRALGKLLKKHRIEKLAD